MSKPVIAAVVTTMDNLPNNREQLAVLRDEPLVDKIIFVDQESRDGTGEWLDAQEDVTVIHRINNGAGPGRNDGIDAAEPFDFVLLLDGGMRPLRGGLGHMLDYLERHPEADAVSTDFRDLETDPTKAWRRWPRPIEDSDTYRSRTISLTHYGLFRHSAWDGFRFADWYPFNQKGWGADDDEMMHRWDDADIVIHAVTGIKAYRRASGSFRRLFKETGVWPNQHGSNFEERLVWLQQEQPHHGKGMQWDEPWLTVVIEAGEVEETALLIKEAHEKLRKRRFDPPWSAYFNPYAVVAWCPPGKDCSSFLDWAQWRRLRQHHGDRIIVDGEIVERQGCSEEQERIWTGDFRVWEREDWRSAIRPNAAYYGLVQTSEDLGILLARYDELWPRQANNKGPDARLEEILYD